LPTGACILKGAKPAAPDPGGQAQQIATLFRQSPAERIRGAFAVSSAIARICGTPTTH